MIPVVVFWTKYTATLNGRVLKLVPCESCSTEYVYVLERQGTGVGTSVYFLNDEGAQNNAESAADESLREYLENDFDAVPCPVCGHYQRYMFPKLYETKSLGAPVAKPVTVALCSLDAIGALYWSIAYLQQPNDHALRWLVVTWSLLAALCLIALGLAAVERSRARRFDPNSEDQQARIQRGRSRAMTRADFETSQQREPGAHEPAPQLAQTADPYQRLRQRVVLLRGQLDEQLAEVVIASLLFLQDQDPRQPITLVISSQGGSVVAGMAIIDTMKGLSPPVRTRCEGSADGLAAVILACGQPGERVVVRGSSLSLMPLTVGPGASDTDPEQTQHLERTQNLLAGLVAERANRGATSVAEDMAAGRSFDAAAAVVYGLADRVVE